jgi:quercetin dioxygenase-like cupin family protein/pyrroloquinoline quinone (PQQ) biosynthesis protein C
MNAVVDSPRLGSIEAPATGSVWDEWLQASDLESLERHPLLEALAGPGNSLGLLKATLAQHSHYSRHFTRYLVSLLGQLGDGDDVLALLQNLREEMGVDGNAELTHAEMFQRTLRRVGVVPAEHPVLPATLGLVGEMMEHCRSSDPLAGLAALCLGAEAIVPLVYRPLLASLEQLGFDAEASEFFRIHIEEDADHALAMLRIMRRMAQARPDRFAHAVGIGSRMIARRVAMFDAVWEAHQAQAAQAAQEADHADARYSSGDFWRVPSRLSARMPARLKHEQVMDSARIADQRFSQQRKHRVHIVDLPSNTISMTIGRLDVDEATRLHRHNYETVIYVLKGEGRSRVGEQEVQWQAGDAFYVPVWAEHSHANTGSEECVYLACENAPLLQNLGGIALREELGNPH